MKGYANNSEQIVEQSTWGFRPLDEPIYFPIEVNGKSLTAKLTGRANSPVQWLLIVEFSDGVTDIFFLNSDMSQEWWAGNKRNMAYARAVSPGLMQAFEINYSKFKI